jgi:hypothetical protein
MPYPEGLEWNQIGVEPTQAKKDEGWLPEEKPPAEYFNWFFNRICQATKHLKEGNQALFWQPTKVYAVGDICYSATAASYKRFECMVAGTSGITEPTWPAVGSTITDGTVTWKVVDIKNFLPLAGGTVTGDILGVTAAQLDNSKKLATTEFVKKAGLQLAATAQYTAGPITLSAAQAGQLIDLASGYTGAITLPAAASIPDGAIYYFWSGANAAVTVQRSGSDTIYINNSTVTSINLNSGDSLILMKTGAVGSGAWIAIGGSAQMIATGSIVSSGAGWIKFADGTLIQNGTTNVTDVNGYCSATFPLTFFNTGYSVAAIHVGTAPVGMCIDGTSITIYGCGFYLRNMTNATGAGWVAKYTAIGRWKA